MTIRSLWARYLVVGALFLGSSAGCGGGSGAPDEEVHRVPGYGISVALPASWDAVSYQSSAEELDEFQRKHPRFLGIAETLRSPEAGSEFAAAEEPGDTRLLLSIHEAEPGYSLRAHIERNLPSLEQDSSGLDVRIHGPHSEIVELARGDAWRIRWSYKGDRGRVQLVQYTFVHGGLVYLLTFSTLKPWEESSELFAASADSIEIGSPAANESITTDGRIAFHRERDEDRSDIYVVDVAGGKEQRLTRTGKDSLPAWSPDGKLIAFASTRDGNSEIYVMEADGSGQRRLTKDSAPDAYPSWSPDGTRIMFTRGRQGDAESTDLYEMNADGTGVRQLTRDGASSDGSWSPDGKLIVFWSDRDLASGIFVMNADGSTARHLTTDFDAAWHPDWSPDGEAILFVGSRDDPTTGDEDTSIYRMTAEGGDPTKIAAPTGYWIDEPEWSPDGVSIAFFSDGQGPGAIWVMSADGTQQRPVTRVGDSHSPSWQPSSG